MAKIIVVDDQETAETLEVFPGRIVEVDKEFVPCSGCTDIVLSSRINKNGYCPNCQEEEMDDLKNQNERENWLIARGWSYNHPGYWRYKMSNGLTVMVGEHVGLYVPNDEGELDQPFLIVQFEDYEGDKVVDLIRNNLLPPGVADAILVAIKHDTYVEPPVWEMACGELMFPDGIMIYNTKNVARNIQIHGTLLTDRPVEDWDAEDHAYLASLAEVIKNWLDNNLS